MNERCNYPGCAEPKEAHEALYAENPDHPDFHFFQSPERTVPEPRYPCMYDFDKTNKRFSLFDMRQIWEASRYRYRSNTQRLNFAEYITKYYPENEVKESLPVRAAGIGGEAK